MLLSAVSVLVIVLQSSEIPEGLMNNPVLITERCLSLLWDVIQVKILDYGTRISNQPVAFFVDL
jgi:hypothetical protein